MDESDPPGGLVPPGPPIEPESAPAPRRDPWASPVDGWPPESTSGSAPNAAYPPPYASGHPRPVRGSQTMAGWALGLSLALCVPFGFLVGAGLAVTVLVRSLDGLAAAESEVHGVVTADVVPCSRPHESEVFHQFDIDSDGYPGVAVVQESVRDCLPDFRSFVGRSYQRSRLELFTFYPTRTTWRLGDHRVDCIVANPDLAPVVGSLAGARR